MEVSSRFIEHNDLGQIHVVRFAPESPQAGEHTVLFPALNGRSTTIDGFGIPYLFAEVSNRTVDFIERPATGLSTLPENRELRRDYRRHGFIAVREALLEAQVSDADPFAKDFRDAKQVHTGGPSLGGHISMLYAECLGERLASITTVDAPGQSKVFVPAGVARFDGYFLFESVMNLLKRKPSVDNAWAIQRPDVVEVLARYRKAHPELPEPPKIKMRDRMAEQIEVLRPTRGAAAVALKNILWSAAEAERKLEVKQQLSMMRFLTDHQSITQTNKLFDDFDQTYPRQSTISYGFLQGPGMGWWHDMSATPGVVKRLLTADTRHLRKRLSYFR